ncbi:uncharacterized protein LOC135217308 isoform X2 [Macrobrachium nipponense]|uniref:uncharacterized protein LOC135217308 isoform X2 n=1 Tax=Macrobrachium nipponense TaxID=159736 RepID=UPI0030C7EE1A
MFDEDNDDFSFLDEEFLKDALQPTSPRKTSSKNREVPKVIQQRTLVNVDKTPSSKSSDTSNKRLNNCGKLFSIDKRKDNERDESAVKDKKTDKVGLNSNLELDDFFDWSDTDNDFCVESLQNTPPDSEFARVSLQQLDDLAQCKEKYNEEPSSSADFRVRILQSLQVQKQLSKTKNESGAKQSLARNVELEPASGTENRKRIHQDDSSDENFNGVIKRKVTSLVGETQGSKSEKNVRDNCSFFTPLKSGQTSMKKSVSPGGPVIQKRKFPGPAGLLPQLGFRTTHMSVQPLCEEDSSPSVSRDIVCSQSSADEFLCGPWQQMLDDLELNQPNQASPLTVFNIKWILRRAALRGYAGVRKIPFLAVMVRSIDASISDATVLLRDKTGEMNGTISSSVLEEYSEAITPGCVLLLRNVTLLSPVSLKSSVGGEVVRRHYLNITLNTIHTIYSSEESGDIITTTVSGGNIKELLQQASALKVTSAPRAIVEEEEEEMTKETPEQKQQLFSHVSNYGNSSSQHIHENWRGPRPYLNTPLSGSPHQKQRFVFNSPLSNNPRPHSYQGNEARPISADFRARFAPRSGIDNQSPKALNASGIVRLQRFPSPLQPSTSGYSFQGFSKVSGPVTQPSQVVNSSSQMSSNIFRSQEEEKEVNDLLENIDEDSLFGDF